MSNLPNIYGRCKAGCEWETIHRSEFEALATNIELEPDVKGYYKLEKGKMYEITRNDNTKFSMQVVVGAVVVLEQELALDTGSHNPTFKLYFSDTSVLDAELNQGKYKYTFMYDLNDKKSSSGIDSTTQYTMGVARLVVSNADKVIEVHSKEITMKNESPNSQETDVGEWELINTASSPSTSNYTLITDTIFVVKGISSSLNINLNGHKCLLSMTDVLAGEITFTSRSASGVTIINQNLCEVSSIDDYFDTINAETIIILDGKFVKGDTILVESNDKGIWNVNRTYYGEL